MATAGAITDAVVTVTVGTTPSMTIAFTVAIFDAGKVDAVITFPARSLTEPTLMAFAVRSPETSPA